ncbi:hypothetical protein ACHHV8_02800 [Paenibacillus sp. TAB 01]
MGRSSRRWQGYAAQREKLHRWMEETGDPLHAGGKIPRCRQE